MATKISLHLIFQKHKDSLKSVVSKRKGNEITETLEINVTDRFIFYVLPILIATFALLVIGTPDQKATDLYTVCLSVFTGLFLNLLVMITSVLRPSVKIWDSKTRIELIEHTFYNISYTIVLSLIGLGFVFLTTIHPFPQTWKINLTTLSALFDHPLSLNKASTYIFTFLLYYILSKIILTLLMVIKRVFCLFRTDIQAYKEEIAEKEKQKFKNIGK